MVIWEDYWITFLLNFKVSRKCFNHKVLSTWIDRAFRGLQDGILLFIFYDWPNLFPEAYCVEQWFFSIIPIFLDSIVSHEYFYNGIRSVWIHWVSREPQDGIFLFIFYDWPKLFLQGYWINSEFWINETRLVVICDVYIVRW